MGTTITVTTTADDTTVDGNCSLREALQAANTDTAVDACPAGNGTDTIVLAALSTYVVSHGALDVTSAVTIEGTLSSGVRTTIDGHQHDCTSCHDTFDVRPGAHLTLLALATTNAGVAIRNDGQLDVELAVMYGDTQRCASDHVSAIDNHGTAHVSHVLIEHSPSAIHNAAGATLAMDHLSMSENGACGVGASIENFGSATLRDANFGGDLHYFDNASSIDNFGTGTLALEHVTFEGNSCQAGTAVFGNEGGLVTIVDSAFDENSQLPIWNTGWLTMHRSRITTNQAWLDSDSNEPGAIYNLGHLDVSDSTIDHNVGSLGGAISNMIRGLVTLTNVTIANNVTRQTDFANPPEPPVPLPSGGITNGAVMLARNTTITANRVQGFADWHYHAGGIVTMPGGYTALSNTIVAGNSAQAPVVAQDCFGAVHSLGYNLIGDLTGCFVGETTTGNIYGLSPDLHPLGVYGGPTMTALPYWNSPATDTANPAMPQNDDNTTCTVLDQRGVTRPRDGNGDGIARCDIGAVER